MKFITVNYRIIQNFSTMYHTLFWSVIRRSTLL